MRLLVVLVGFVVLAGPSAAAGPLRTGLIEPNQVGPEYDVALERIRDAGATLVRTTIPWPSIAPSERPSGFNPRNHSDAAYRWESFDLKLRRLVVAGLEPVVALNSVPLWARAGPGANSPPRAHDLFDFASAAATRYSGRTAGVPRVRYWQLWIEPNVNLFFSPLFLRGKPVAPATYRSLLNAFARAVHGGRAGNFVIAGGLSPFTVDRDGLLTIGPLRFMREMLCVSRGARPRPTCNARSTFDIWAHHPYTSGGPDHQALHPDDASLGDLPEMRRLLDAARRHGHIVAPRPVRFWVTEFSWDTKPPDPNAVPLKLHARWVAEALNRMWMSGVEVVMWLQLRDAEEHYQGGLYFAGPTIAADRPKPALAAFRFPFVAYRDRQSVRVWGRLPEQGPGRVVIEQSFVGGWKRVATLRADRYGIFEARLAIRSSIRDFVRARPLGGGRQAVPFSLRRPPDLPVNPFGG